jgi:hypothetical protein
MCLPLQLCSLQLRSASFCRACSYGGRVCISLAGKHPPPPVHSQSDGTSSNLSQETEIIQSLQFDSKLLVAARWALCVSGSDTAQNCLHACNFSHCVLLPRTGEKHPRVCWQQCGRCACRSVVPLFKPRAVFLELSSCTVAHCGHLQCCHSPQLQSALRSVRGVHPLPEGQETASVAM